MFSPPRRPFLLSISPNFRGHDVTAREICGKNKKDKNGSALCLSLYGFSDLASSSFLVGSFVSFLPELGQVISSSCSRGGFVTFYCSARAVSLSFFPSSFYIIAHGLVSSVSPFLLWFRSAGKIFGSFCGFFFFASTSGASHRRWTKSSSSSGAVVHEWLAVGGAREGGEKLGIKVSQTREERHDEFIRDGISCEQGTKRIKNKRS